jgi:hypothetical protein
MKELKKYTDIIDSRLSNSLNNLEEKSLKELEDIKNIKDNIFKLKGKILE